MFFLLLFVIPEFGMLAISLGAPALEFLPVRAFPRRNLLSRRAARTLLLGLLVTIVTLGLALPLAYWLARMPARRASLLLVLATFPLWISAVVRSFGWIVLLARNGSLARPCRPSAWRRRLPARRHTMRAW